MHMDRFLGFTDQNNIAFSRSGTRHFVSCVISNVLFSFLTQLPILFPMQRTNCIGCNALIIDKAHIPQAIPLLTVKYWHRFIKEISLFTLESA